MARWIAALAAALLLPACGDNGSGTSDAGGRTPQDDTGDLGSGQPPFVRIVSPGPRTTVHEGATILLQAVAADPNAILAQVSFFDGDRLIGSKTAAPYIVAAGALQAGTHVFTAVAIDIEGRSAVSPPVTVFVVRRGGGDDDEDDDRPSHPQGHHHGHGQGHGHNH